MGPPLVLWQPFSAQRDISSAAQLLVSVWQAKFGLELHPPAHVSKANELIGQLYYEHKLCYCKCIVANKVNTMYTQSLCACIRKLLLYLDKVWCCPELHSCMLFIFYLLLLYPV